MNKYQIIYADPPWAYKNSPSKKGTTRVFAKNHYDLTSTEELKKLKVDDISEDNSICLMWATLPMLPDALDLMKSWGFGYKTTAFVWVKKNKIADSFFWGGGYYTRSNVEMVLLGVKGKILERKTQSIHQIIYEPVGKHSAKPKTVMDKIVELFGDIPRIELFAREKTEGWDVWGNEVESDIDLTTHPREI